MSHTTTVHLDNKEQQQKLSEIAASLGLFQTRGVGTGTVGNVSELCKALADGRCKVVVVRDEDQCAE